MSHTPQQIADLARAALAWNQKSKDFKPNDMERAAAIRDWMAYHEAVRDPATVLALCERLDEAEALLSTYIGTAKPYTTTPLVAETPTAPRAGEGV